MSFAYSGLECSSPFENVIILIALFCNAVSDFKEVSYVLPHTKIPQVIREYTKQ